MLFKETEMENLLPYDGEAVYWSAVYGRQEADVQFDQLRLNIAWRNDEVMMFGKRIVTKRKTAWYGRQDFSYTYANISRQALPFTPLLRQLQLKAEQLSGSIFNACLLNLYHTGAEGMGWHSDDEPEIEHCSAIASFSFGAERKFVFKHKKTKETTGLLLHHGSLLVMKDCTQIHWLHRLPPTKTVTQPRINLTYRKMREEG